jgi:type VI secretion system secreted protein VgrG
MSLLALSFECGDDSLSVRRFAVREGISSLFEVSVVARSPNDDLDLGAFVGRGAAIRVAPGAALGAQVWAGVCSFMEQDQAEPSGLSTYTLRIAPGLWLLGHRRNHRIFQHRSVPEIVSTILAEWGIDPVWALRRDAYPPLEYRVQYGESDLAFVERLLEEAGISYFFANAPERRSALVLSDAPEAAPPREGGAVPFADHPNPVEPIAHVTRVRVREEVRHGKATIRDFDFRRPDFPLFGRASAAGEVEERLERYGYAPGAFVVEGGAGGDTPVADDKGVARADEKAGTALADRQLAGERADRRSVSFETNATDVGPGVVLSIARHPRGDLAPDRSLLVIERSLEGTFEGLRPASCRAGFASVPHRPRMKTPKPRVQGVQSAVVVGPAGEEIHTDELGRVRVQFHWDREGRRDGDSSCWMRVSQGWAGGGYGMITLPRVGHEVLVGFFEGDPDQPLVVGRVFNGTARVPYDLPAHRTRSTWRSDSSPGSSGFNEIMMEDAKGRELVYVQAERDLDKLVKHDETVTVGRRRATRVGEVDEAAIGVREASHIEGTPTGREMVAGRITLTTGEATITLEGPNISLQAAANILLGAGASILANAGANVVIQGAANITVASGATAVVKAGGGDLVLEGGPMVRIAPGAGGGVGPATGPRVLNFGEVPVVVPPGVDLGDNVRAARDRLRSGADRAGFVNQVFGDDGEWCFGKRGPEYAPFHHFHFGVVGAGIGLPKGVLVRYARDHHQEDPETPFDAGALAAAGWGLGRKAPPEPPRAPGAEASPLVEGWTAHRLCDLGSWEHHQLVRADVAGAAPITIALRPRSEERRIEYEAWSADGDEPRAAGSLPDDHEGRDAALRAVVREHPDLLAPGPRAGGA